MAELSIAILAIDKFYTLADQVKLRGRLTEDPDGTPVLEFGSPLPDTLTPQP